MAFAKVPVELLLDHDLTPGARTSYGILLHMAYRAGRKKQSDAVELSPTDTIATAMPCAVGTARKYLNELRDAGWIEIARGGGRGRTSSYRVLEAAKGGQKVTSIDDETGSKNDLLDRGDTRARDPLLELQKDVMTASSPVPPLVKIDGRNVAFDALREECRIAEGSPRTAEVYTALNGTHGRNPRPGIREQFWRELIHQYGAETIVARQADAPEAFEEAFARAIRTRCVMYRFAMSGAFLSPLALAKYWTDLPSMMEDRQPTDAASQLMREANKLREEGR